MKIGFIATYEELRILVQKISKEMDINVNVFMGVYDEGIRIAKQLERENYDIVISRGANYFNIAKALKIPVINCDVTSFDILYALHEALKITKRIALIIHEDISFDKSLISEILDIDLLYMTSYKTFEESQQMLMEAHQKGFKVVIGGVTTMESAIKLGMKGILLQTSQETIRQVLKNAVEIINISKKQMLQAERLNQILNFSHEGIIVVDSNGEVTLFNPTAEKLMAINAVDIIGQKADRYIPTTGLIEVINSGEPQLGALQKINHTTILTNRVPIKIKNVVYGAVATFQDISQIQDYEAKIRSEIYKKGLLAKYTFGNYIGESPKIKMLIEKASIYAKSDSTVLIDGESGTGKEILAQGMHNKSERKNYPFVAVNCSAIPENLLESELFGYEEGAFTGAKKGGKMGMFELAHKGTLFLDEIGSMPMNLQSGLLRVLQEREVWRIGSNRVVNVDVRIIAATNNDLLGAVERGEFRRDLYYRLNILKIKTIPLRDRKLDIEIIFKYLIKNICDTSISLSDRLKTLMMDYYWPGNVRELENYAKRVALLREHISMEEIFEEFVSENSQEINVPTENVISVKKGTFKAMEKEILERMYIAYGENATLLSEKLEISRTTIWKKLKS